MRSADGEGAVRILHLTTVHARGDTRIHLKEVRTLARAFDGGVALAVADGKGPSREGTRVFDLGRLDRGRGGRWLRGSVRAYRLVRRLRPWAVHFHDPELIPLGLLLRARGHRVVYDAHEDLVRQVHGKHWIPRPLRYPMAAASAALEWVGARAFDAVVVATPSIGRRFPEGKRALVQNFPVRAELQRVEALPYRERPPAFVYVGGVSESRGAGDMVEAMARLDDVPGARLDLAGTVERPAYGEALERLPGWAAVRFHGFVDRERVAALLSVARAGLVPLHPLPNYLDSQPIKMFEYMAAGLPVIASDFLFWRRIVEDAGCGILVASGDPDALAAAMRWMLDHPDEAEAMGARGREAVDARYNWEAEANTLVDLYRRLGAAP